MAGIEAAAPGAPRQSPPPAGAREIEPAWPQDVIDALPLNPRHALVFGLCAAGLLFESLNLQLMSFAAPLIGRAWGLGPRALGLAISAAIVGMLVGTYVFGALADRIGRRPVFQITVAIFSLLTALCGLSATLWQLAAARFVAGLGIGGSIPVETAVLAEFTPSRWRDRALAVWAMALPVGGLLAPLIVAAAPDSFGWRGLLFLGGAPALLVLVLRRAIPETPQHLAARGRRADAAAALAWLQGGPAAAPVESSADGVRMSAQPVRRLFSGPLRRATTASWVLNFGTLFAYYGFVLWLPSLLSAAGAQKPAVLRFMLAVALSGLAGRAALLALAGRLPRSASLATCGLLAAGALLGFGLAGAANAAWPLAALAAFFLEGTFSILIPFVAGVYPAEVRATGVGWAIGMGRIGMALAPICMGAAASLDARLPVLLLAAVSGLTALVGLGLRGLGDGPVGGGAGRA